MNDEKSHSGDAILDPALAAFIDQLAIAAVERQIRHAKIAEHKKLATDQKSSESGSTGTNALSENKTKTP